MATKLYDIAVKTGEYTNRNNETKANWLNIGAVFKGDKGQYMVLNRTFNPAGVPNPENRDSVLCAMFEPRQQATSQPSQAPQAAPVADDFDDSDIPW